MHKHLLFLLFCLWSCTASYADYPLTSLQDFWNSSVSGSTITFSNWGGAGWYLNGKDCSAFDQVEITMQSASQAGNIQVYYNGESNPSTKINFEAGSTRITANLDASRRNNVEKIVLSCEQGALTINSARLVGNGNTGNTGNTDNTGGNITPTGKGFRVNGNQLLDAKNNPFRPLGTNLAYAWFKGQGFDTPLEQMALAGANSVRIVLSDGKQYNKDNANTVSAIISKCEQQHLVAVLEVHDATGSDDASALQDAAAYWASMASVVKGHEHTVIINIANEWMGTWSRGNDYLNAYTQAINTIRQAGVNHCLMVDAPGWGQDVNTLVQECKNILAADPLHNTMFSIHMYGTAGKPGKVEYNINSVMNKGVCLCIGEYGWYHTDGDVDEDAIISYCAQVGIGHLAWSWWGNGSQVQYLDMVTQINSAASYTTVSNGSQSCNWGEKVMNCWRNEAQLCTIYTNAPVAGDNPPATSNNTATETSLVQSTLIPEQLVISAPATFVVLDCMGRLIKQGVSYGMLAINTSSWNHGTYILRTIDGNCVKLFK